MTAYPTTADTAMLMKIVESGNVHRARMAHAQQFRHLFERRSRDQWRGQQEGEARRRFPRHVPPQSRDDGDARTRDTGKQRQGLRATPPPASR